ncbi:MAG: hypothetical protein WCF33_06915 [Pseudonocardiaceae bacterium]
MAMRLHITLDDALVGDLDRVVGARERSSFIAKAVRRAIEEIIRGLRPSEQPAADALFTAVRVLPIQEPDARRAGAW